MSVYAKVKVIFVKEKSIMSVGVKVKKKIFVKVKVNLCQKSKFLSQINVNYVRVSKFTSELNVNICQSKSDYVKINICQSLCQLMST